MAEEVKFIFSMDDQFTAKAKQAEASVGGLESKLSNIGNLVAAAFSINAIKNFGSAVVDAYSKNEMYEARLTTLLHDRTAATNELRQITLDAAKTPFDKESLIQGNSMLIGAGESASGARRAILDLGNAIAATGGGSDELKRMSVNLAQIRTIGKASALDVKQFMYANIPIYDMLAKSMHKNVKEIKDMDISYQDLTKALADARKEGGMFYEGMENASKTLTGQISNLGDSWEQLKVSIGNSQSGILKDTIDWANKMVSAMNKSFERTEMIKSAITKRGGNYMSYFGGSEKTQANLEELSNLVSNAIERSGNGNTLKEQKYLINLMKVKKEQYGSEARDMNDMVSLRIRANQFKNEMAVIQEGLARIKGMEALKKPNKAAENIAETEKKQKDSKAKESSKVASQKYTQITINIDKLIEDFNVETSTMEKGATGAKEQVVKALIEAVNDSQIVAGI